ncbi:MAG: rhomboid family intramembrane serine protease [Pseudomonadales bacterium]|nr:rhomboid family intramembrane serine protease [Pseudomonadales bacterium]
MFPLSDDNPRLHTPYATFTLIALNVLAWALVQGFGDAGALTRSICQYGLVPGDLLGRIPPGTGIELGPGLGCRFDGDGSPFSLVTSMFLHGSWFHIIGNLWFLWVFGDNVEDQLGPVRFFVFYLLCGLAAAGAQIASHPESIVPMVGASGAIGGVMGAYAILYPRARVNLLIFLGFYVTTLAVPAIWMLGYWFLLQIIGGIPALGSGEGGVAFWAHVGGFVAGLLLIMPLRVPRATRRRSGPGGRDAWF